MDDRSGALEGRLDWGWLLAWALLLLSSVLFRLFTTWSQGLLALGAGGLLKRRLLYGALRLEPEELRSQGAGQLLGRVIESEAVESLALSGGLFTLLAGVELIMATVVLGIGVGGLLHALFLLGWIALALLMGQRYFRHFRHWTKARLRMTHDLVERMVGHRTRLAQEAREHWHDGEDQTLERYLARSGAMDRDALVQALIPGGWLVLSLLGIALAFVSGHGSPAALAVSLGELLQQLAHWESWLQVCHPLWARRSPGSGSHPSSARRPARRSAGYQPSPSRSAPIGTGPRIGSRSSRRTISASATMSGASLFSKVATCRSAPVTASSSKAPPVAASPPSHPFSSACVSLNPGLLFRGLDWQTLGAAGWRRQVVAAPQFHENYVLTGTFAFNLLMGRRWPAQPEDLHEAEAICRELDLGDLPDRMPAGMLQLVGETGWQLSHGERSRLYIARALLQNAASSSSTRALRRLIQRPWGGPSAASSIEPPRCL